MPGAPLEQLAQASGRAFPHLTRARAQTTEGLIACRARLQALEHQADVSVVLMGSWGRAELTSGSDDDFMVLLAGAERAQVRPSVEQIQTVLDRAPGDQGIFGAPVASEQLIEKIGLERDNNSNLSRRMLLLLESVHATGAQVHQAVRAQLVDRYLDHSVKGFRPPRFLLNDVIRYWRTICVDFAGKEREGPHKWGLRNAKLRTSRKVLFAGGLLPVFECAWLEHAQMPAFLREQFDMSPTDRIAQAFLSHHAADPGGRALGAYDDFLGLLDQAAFREELEGVTRESSRRSEAFGEAARLGKELEQGLSALLFETSLYPLVREYGIF
jgi:hypothetical protein